MSDLVKRLRWWAAGQDICKEAADEIERLTKERDEARRTVRMAHEEGTKQLADCQKDAELANETFARIVEWCRAYPIDVFVDPDWEDVKAKLGSTLLTQVSAANFRHVLKGVEQIIIGAQGVAMKEQRT